jgi:hypothetical protein
MGAELADRLADHWHEECQEHGMPTDSYHALKRGLRNFLPTDALAGIAYRDDHPVVLAIAADALLFFAPPGTDEILDALAIPVASIRGLAAACGHTSTVHANYRACTWTLHVGNSERQVLESRSVVGNGFASDNGGERVMLALAKRLGWSTPLHHKNATDQRGNQQ